jgi:hypothetical protein
MYPLSLEPQTSYRNRMQSRASAKADVFFFPLASVLDDVSLHGTMEMCGAVMMCAMRYCPRVTNEIVDVVEGTETAGSR